MRSALIEHFRDEGSILLATEAAAEGIKTSEYLRDYAFRLRPEDDTWPGSSACAAPIVAR